MGARDLVDIGGRHRQLAAQADALQHAQRHEGREARREAAQARLVTPITVELQAIARTRPCRSASIGNRIAPINCPIAPEAISQPICAGPSPHLWISNGKVAAMVITSKPSKKVAVPISTRARICSALVGRRSRRATTAPGVAGAEAADTAGLATTLG